MNTYFHNWWENKYKSKLGLIENAFKEVAEAAWNASEAISLKAFGSIEFPLPKPGDEIYISSGDDYFGGLAKIKTVTIGMSGGEPTYDISVEEVPRVLWNYKYIYENQDILKTLYPHRAKMEER